MFSAERISVKYNIALKNRRVKKGRTPKNSIQHHQKGRQRDLCINYHTPLRPKYTHIHTYYRPENSIDKPPSNANNGTGKTYASQTVR